ncbi:MAG: hypothetical protein ABIJ45_09365 [Candidatus Zixiibacteriota bacterium]
MTGLLVIFCGSLCAKIDIPISPLNMPVKTVNLSQNITQSNYVTIETSSTLMKRKSTTKAVFLSLLLPGAGQLYLGEKGRGEVFIGAEIVFWGAFATFQTLGNWKKDDYISYAERHARVDTDGKGDGFYKNLVYYDSRDEYNESAWIADPANPVYPSTPEYYWQWDSAQSQLDFRDLRNESENNFRKASFMIGAAIFNRILAGIDTFRIAKKLNRRLSSGEFTKFEFHNIKLDIDANPFGNNPNLSLTLSHRF